MSGAGATTEGTGCDDEALCYECRRSLPRTAMRWGVRASGPVWNPVNVRVYRCADCLNESASVA